MTDDMTQGLSDGLDRPGEAGKSPGEVPGEASAPPVPPAPPAPPTPPAPSAPPTPSAHGSSDADTAETLAGSGPRVRFAPSPTGFLHIGGLRTAIYNWAFARRHGGSFILRIDDTDPKRSTVENTEAILRAMRWAGLDWDEGPVAPDGNDDGSRPRDGEGADPGGGFGPYFQARRTAIYDEALQTLKDKGRVYPCFCTPCELDAKRKEAQERDGAYSGYDRTCRDIPAAEARARIAAGEEHTWRLRVPESGEDIVVDDLVYGRTTFPLEVMDDLVLVRSDRSPTYNFVTVVDDWKMRISHVIRGDDHLSNTPRQILIYRALDATPPAFVHLPMILGEDGKRLSKRHGATNVEAFRDLGFLPEAMVNYLALLGWSLDGETTIISASELCASFSPERISRNPAIFDPAKLEWMNGVYIRGMGADAFTEALLPFLREAGFSAPDGTPLIEDAALRPEWYRGIYPLINERVKTLADAPAMLRFIFCGDDLEYDEAAVDKILRKDPDSARAVLTESLDRLESMGRDWGFEGIDAALSPLPERLEMKPRIVFQVLRVALSGSQVSPPLFEAMELLGGDLTLSRLRRALELTG